ncbi:type I-F CRISPR-associated helicase Cas3 [Modicisalibacter tunisiensis]|uniref:type I-F CRISPR-associated helicase Cas3f n=1 Tax=Modicisalibacter tunisiensis TaxID=390637 RepID=UPI001CCA7EA8|nr:type I-F CRISPR-associated helicase Cas3f [Modicisalibacter tunisiensis]MBZ9539519.1 type I-F CRISPR-associated helicase Cas3 [Modicisalibacter tunisiensis]
MNVLLVSQCSKNALKEARRILDQFAERRGERTWQTSITQAGLDTLRKLLRSKARKNTAVACHWIRGHDHSELMWVVGDASQFNARGAAPTNTTRRNILRTEDENDWHTGQLIHLLASLAALFHDLGKSTQAFQWRLKGKLDGRNLVRHEWASLRLLQAFVGDDDDASWLERLLAPSAGDDACWLNRLKRDGLDPLSDEDAPFRQLPPIAAAIGWLILSHHRVPALPAYDDGGHQKPVGVRGHLNAASLPRLPEAFTVEWNERLPEAPDADLEPWWYFPHGLPIASDAWRARGQRLARQLLGVMKTPTEPPLDNPFVMHLARLALMLSDHHYSSLTGEGRLKGDWNTDLYANTTFEAGKRKLCQPLDEHLLGVTRGVGEITHRLPDMVEALPSIARHKGFKKRSQQARFRWQDRAFDLATGLRDRARSQGFFGVNMASTGCGKTLANGRILYALADPEKGARFSIALGLRTLTLQTGQAYRERLGLGSDDLAVRVGGSATRALFEHQQSQAEESGSASRESLFDDQGHVHFEGRFDDHPLLAKAIADPNAKALISAPILVCTIDHLVPATESLRGGHQIAPMLRLMSGDLVLDEPDDFDIDDLPALTRLVHWAGMLGSRVLLSSATLPPALVRGLFDAYLEGRRQFQRNRGEPGRPVNICCAWFDEHDRRHVDCADGPAFGDAHDAFARKRAARLADDPPRRRARLVPVSAANPNPEIVRPALAQAMLDQALALHGSHHTIDPHSGKRVSFGLIRLANIEPLVEVAMALYRTDMSDGYRIHLCVYHSQFPLLLRSRIEERLDRTLDRSDEMAVFDLPDVRHRLDRTDEPDQLFVVLGSPVTEVGRDHDYDWAVVEPSSMRSIIQLAGRVRRHRPGAVEVPNVALLDANVKALERKRPAFCRPGFETEQDWPLAKHRLTALLRESDIDVIDSRPRLLAPEPLEPREKLVDLEHARLAALMVEGAAPAPARRRSRLKKPASLGAYLFYRPASMSLSALAAQQQPFREDNEPDSEFVLFPDETEERYDFRRVDHEGKDEKLTQAEAQLDRLPDASLANPRITPWNDPDYMGALADQADAMGMTLEQCAMRFGRIRLKPGRALNGWHFHSALGFLKRK